MSSNNKNKEEDKNEDSPYEILVRSLTNRGKNKRKVKLVEDKLIQLTFADHEDSEDDEDFTLDDADLDSDDSNYGICFYCLCIIYYYIIMCLNVFNLQCRNLIIDIFVDIFMCI